MCIPKYTARSVLTQAYGEVTPAIDTNVERVLIRIFRSETETDWSSDDLRRMAERLAPEGSSSDFTHALIDFGGLVCTATVPNCAECVVRGVCDYYERAD